VSTRKWPEAFIFDMDGVLIDSERPFLGLLRQLLSEDGVERDVADLRAVCGRPATFFRSHVAPWFDGDAAFDAFLDRYSEGKRALLEAGAIQPFPLAREVLERLGELGVRLAVATTTRRELAMSRLVPPGLAGQFDEIITGDQVVNGKPAPDIFLEAARRLGVEPERCVAVEDSLAGIAAARAAGMAVYALATTFPPEELGGADRVMAGLGELLSHIEGELAATV
jgi:mannitol-1-/sugar-/sorbitol-6-phosphatase